MTSPTLPPEAEALVQEALYKLGPRNDRAEVYQLSILRDLARRLLEARDADWKSVLNNALGSYDWPIANVADAQLCIRELVREGREAEAKLEAAEQSLSSLRADGWLEKAAEEIAGIAPDESWMPQGVVAVLKRHRDGA